MKPPILLDARGDLFAFDSLDEALAFIEPTDVRNNEYVAYDSEGRLLRLGVVRTKIFFGLLDGPEEVVLTGAEPTPGHASQLRAALVAFLTQLGVAPEWLARASHEQLVARAVENVK